MTPPLSNSQALAKAKRQHEYYTNLQWGLYAVATNCRAYCVECGYGKSVAALHLHHPDPTIKTRKFNQRNWSPKDLDDPKFMDELKGCVLLCANCHAEHHANNTLTRLAQDVSTE